MRGENASLIPIFADFHMHTTYSDEDTTPLEQLIKTRKVGLDAISVTDHHTTKGSKIVKELVTSCGSSMIVILGQENPCDFPNTHTLALNVPENIDCVYKDCPQEIQGSPEKMSRWAKQQGIVLFHPHPAWSNHAGTNEAKLNYTLQLLQEGLIDGFEIVNHCTDVEGDKSAIDFYHKWKDKGIVWPVLGNSDHGQKGGVYNVVFAESFTEEAILKAIRNKKVVVLDKRTNGIYGPDDLVDIVEVYKDDFLPFHNSLAEEAKLMRLFFGGHQEKKEEILKLRPKWESLYKEHLPFVRFKIKKP